MTVRSVHRRKVSLLAAAALSLAALVAAAPSSPATASSTSVASETQYRDALATLSGDPAGPHTILLTADITFAQSGDAIFTGTQELTIDGQGGTCSGEVTVSVPKNQGKKGAAVDDGALYDSTAS